MQNFPAWVANAPDGYKADGFLSSHVPMAITSRYGQNLQVGASEVPERAWWDRFRNFEHIRYMCVALASDIG
jgi:hypothetical protein